MAGTEESIESGGGTKKASPLTTIAAIAVVSLLAAGGGWFLGMQLGAPKSHDEPVAKIEQDQKKLREEEEARRISTEANGVKLLEPMTTNLAYPADNWIRMEVSLVFADKPDVALAEEIHQDILAYVRTVSLQQIEGPRGFVHLKDDLKERAYLRSEGRVTDVVFRTFVIE